MRCLGWPNPIWLLPYKEGRFPGGSDGKAPACNEGDLGLIAGLGRSPGEGNGNPFPVLLPGKLHGRRSLVGYSPQGHKELDTTEWLHFIKRECGYRHVCTERNSCEERIPPSTKSSSGLKKSMLLTLWSQTSNLQKYKKKSMLFKPPNLWDRVMAAWVN